MKKNKYRLTICQFNGHGHYKVGFMWYGKEYTTVTSDMPSIDDYKSDEWEKDGRKLKWKQGQESLVNQIKRANNLGEYKNL